MNLTSVLILALVLLGLGPCGPGSLDAERELPWLRRLLRLVLEK